MAQNFTQALLSPKKRWKFIEALLQDIEALDMMLAANLLEANMQRIGAEQELCIVDRTWKPAPLSRELLDILGDPCFTTELARYNLEIILDPLELGPGSFDRMGQILAGKYRQVQDAAETLGARIVLAGILPTISRRELSMENLTPLLRYHHLARKLRALRGQKFDLYLKGVDEIHIRHDSIMFEACNTSFQAHLQIPPQQLVAAYNWALAIAGPVLAASANSPLLLGKELWSETRIALFRQSIDTRQNIHEVRQQSPRVTFGMRWIQHTITEIFKEDISRFAVLIADTFEEDAPALLREGKVPSLHALRLHNSTVYRWNRLCYGITEGRPHLRIENRYLPAGPTLADEIANMAFWTGLMTALPPYSENIEMHFDFNDVKSNFYKAARSGIESIFIWREKEIPAKELIRTELLPLAWSGLQRCGIGEAEIYLHLGIIEKRLDTHTAAQWQVRNYRRLRKEVESSDATAALTMAMYQHQQKNIPVCAWKDIDLGRVLRRHIKNLEKVHQLMSTDVLTLHPDDTVSLATHIMEWNQVPGIIIEDHKNKLRGIITLETLQGPGAHCTDPSSTAIRDVMHAGVITIDPDEKIARALEIMQQNNIAILPVVRDGTLLGNITQDEIRRWLQVQRDR